MHKPVLVVHGGAIMDPTSEWEVWPGFEKQYHNTLKKSLEVGYELLHAGKSAIDAVEGSIRVLEDSPLFNAGKGATFTDKGKNELDASIMDGDTLEAGAVTQITTIKNPISAARIIMENSPYIFLSGKGAEDFVKKYGITIVPKSYFYNERKYQEYLAIKQEENSDTTQSIQKKKTSAKKGTVGAVALDIHGNLAAGTSTGGLENKHYGRIGDSPIIGAGTYANNKTCAISATGYGEYFIRGGVAYDISALMEYKSFTLEEAAKEVIMHKQVELGKYSKRISAKLCDIGLGLGGVIGVDRKGNFTFAFNCAGMFRGYIDKKGNLKTCILKNEDYS